MQRQMFLVILVIMVRFSDLGKSVSLFIEEFKNNNVYPESASVQIPKQVRDFIYITLLDGTNFKFRRRNH